MSDPKRMITGMRTSGVLEREFVPPSYSRLSVIRNGHRVVREWKIPKPVVLVDTREQRPWRLLDNHPNWIGGEKRAALKAGDYSVEGMQELLALERKSMVDVIRSTMAVRARFIASCARLSKLRWKAILIEATYENMKSPYREMEDLETGAHPNAVVGTLDAIEAKFGVPVIYTSPIRHLAEERAASWLSKHFTYWWLEEHGHGRVLVDEDGL
jgi:ERCC4-type nuclease